MPSFFSPPRTITLSRPIRLLTGYVAVAMAYAMGFLSAWISKLPELGVLAAFMTLVACSLYVFCFGIYLLWRYERACR
jgi:ABC-type nickel/cobalt efflux system permease component RcnA